MSFTRFHDDSARIEKQLEESTGPGRYMINMPGNGDKPCFMEDPYIRLQHWGANLRTNTIDLESNLKGLSSVLTKDCITSETLKQVTSSQAIEYPSHEPITEQPRASHPAWTVRDLEQVEWQAPHTGPQAEVTIPFANNLSSRIIEKDNYKTEFPCINNFSNME